VKCSEVITVVPGKDYTYCENEGTMTVGGNPFCPRHGVIVDAREGSA